MCNIFNYIANYFILINYTLIHYILKFKYQCYLNININKYLKNIYRRTVTDLNKNI